MSCNACGSNNLIEGKISDNAGSTEEYFMPKDVSSFKTAFGFGYKSVTAYACVHCGNLQFIVHFDDKDKQRYLKFEGQQSDLLERINDET